MRRLLMVCAMLGIMVSCQKKTPENMVEYLPKMNNISLSYRGQYATAEIPIEDVSGISVETKYNSHWISQLELIDNNITFYAIENNERDRGYRQDTIFIYKNSIKIGNICVVQARNCISSEPLEWATEDAIYYKEGIDGLKYSGQEITRMIYELEETTGGKDNYKNYPAFAYCIEMNIDPKNNLEWHLPDIEQMENCRGNRQDYLDTPFAEHTNWWSASDSDDSAWWLYSKSIASRGPNPKFKEYYVMAFRNGEMID